METVETVCAAVLGHVRSALEADSAPCQVNQVVVGGVVVDLGVTGLLAVGPEGVTRTIAPWPTPSISDNDQRGYGQPIACSVVVGVYRCVPVVDDNGNPPSLELQQVAHSRIMRDASLVWNVLAGAAVLGLDAYGDEPLWERAGLSQTFPPLLGGTGGSETRVTFGIPWSLWCFTD